MNLKMFLSTAVVFAGMFMPVVGVLAGTSASPDPTESAFRALYKELVETNTTLSVGSCTLAAERLSKHLAAAGYAGDDLRLYTAPGHPKEGGLVATLKGTGATKKAILLLAHLDVVEAKREDWTRDPFTMVEENGYFYGRGVADDKAMAAIFTDLMIRYRQEGYRPKRDIKLALTCGEETTSAFNGAAWLAANHKDWIDAEFAINEGGGGEFNGSGVKTLMSVQSGEKVNQNFILETTNPGGHSSMPAPANALYEMAQALNKLQAYEFPVLLNDTTRGYFTTQAQLTGGTLGAAMLAIVKDPTNAAAYSTLSKNLLWHTMLRTTCVGTTIQGGHAVNALPQKVRVNVNCRIFPGVSVDAVRDTLIKVIGNSAVTVTTDLPLSPTPPAPVLTPRIMKPLERVMAEFYPGVPIVPTMAPFYTDGRQLNSAGIPTYGIDGTFSGADGDGVHGLNERVLVQEVMIDRRFHHRLVKLYADAE
jgi:acetylornithine deacetylase/succinyl-diaminopimelate desuccinylase-like protein